MSLRLFAYKKKRSEIVRNPDRLDSFYDELKRIHKEYFPDWRFGQLCSNFFGWLAVEKKMDLFFPEENEMIEYIREYVSNNSKIDFT